MSRISLSSLLKYHDCDLKLFTNCCNIYWTTQTMKFVWVFAKQKREKDAINVHRPHPIWRQHQRIQAKHSISCTIPMSESKLCISYTSLLDDHFNDLRFNIVVKSLPRLLTRLKPLTLTRSSTSRDLKTRTNIASDHAHGKYPVSFKYNVKI
jgi:hypothetical protein